MTSDHDDSVDTVEHDDGGIETARIHCRQGDAPGKMAVCTQDDIDVGFTTLQDRWDEAGYEGPYRDFMIEIKVRRPLADPVVEASVDVPDVPDELAEARAI